MSPELNGLLVQLTPSEWALDQTKSATLALR